MLEAWDHAYVVDNEVVQLCRMLHNREPGPHRVALIRSLHDVASTLRKLDRAREARDADREAASLRDLTGQIIRADMVPVGHGAHGRAYRARWHPSHSGSENPTPLVCF